MFACKFCDEGDGRWVCHRLVRSWRGQCWSARAAACKSSSTTPWKYRAQRQAKFQRTRCPTCVAKLVEQQRIASTLPKKGEAFKQLPADTVITLQRRPDATWTGTLVAGGKTVEATGEGPQGVTVTLARMWALNANSPAPASPKKA